MVKYKKAKSTKSTPSFKREVVDTSNIVWSEYQKALFEDIATGKGHTIVNAFAGSAKTTSIIESFKYIPEGTKALALAFNKVIQEELRSRASGNIKTLTFHSIGLSAIKQRFGDHIELDNNKVFDIVTKMFDFLPYEDRDIINNICDTVAYCKYGLVDSPAQIDSVIDRFSIDTCDYPRDQFISYVIKTLAEDKADTAKIDFNDMCWFPFVYNLYLGEYDYVYVDEVQDLNKAQLVMALKACKETGRIIAVGDFYQALYSWRMADTSVIEELKNKTDSKILPLPISYRCPKSVIELAKKWVPTITCPENALEGEVRNISTNQLYELAKPGCFILSRTNAPLIKTCLAFIKRGVRANIRGRDVGAQLSVLIKKSKKKTIESFLKWLDIWKEKEVKHFESKKLSTESVLDRYDCLITLCEESDSLSDVKYKIDSLFNDTDEKQIIVLSTVHRAKGLERENVFLLRWTFRVWLDDCETLSQPNEEANIAYVAATRSKKNLFLVNKWK
jgi:superfamily I DNA/RNA helicase